MRPGNAAPGKRVANWRRGVATGAPLPAALPIAGIVTDEPPATAAASQRTPPVAVEAVPTDGLDRVAGPDPVYPAEALHARTRGWVELEFTITPTGSVRDVEVRGARPIGVFEDAATTALAQWRFRPRVVNGQALPQRSSITLRFDVDG